MIVAHATGGNNKGKLIILGVARENIDALTAGRPIRVSAESHPSFPPDLTIAIVFGETLRDVIDQLTPFTDGNTKVVTVPREGGRTPS